MKKRALLAFIGFMSLTLMSGCTGGKSNESKKENTVSNYKYTNRKLAEPEYLKAASKFAGGKGTKENPYQISNAAQLVLMEEQLNEADQKKGETYRENCYVLTKDIDINDISSVEQLTEKSPKFSWKPINSMLYKGIFDGKGHTIRGMYINVNAKDNFKTYGMFGTFNGTVKNLTISDSYIAVSGKASKTGGIVGRLWINGVIENCVSKVTMDCYDGSYGGIVGESCGGMMISKEYKKKYQNGEEPPFSIIKNSSFQGVIHQKKEKTSNSIGGIIGEVEAKISGCKNSGTIQFGGVDLSNAGGIAGRFSEGVILDCENSGTVKCTMKKGKNTGAAAGGIVGNLSLTSAGSKDYMSRGVEIADCCNIGNVSAQEWAGGIVGKAANIHNDWCLRVINCKNEGKVESNDYTGGVIAYLACSGDDVHGNNIAIRNCENTADISQGKTGGIISIFQAESGQILIDECKNTGKISTTNGDCAGIISLWQILGRKPDVDVTMIDCKNNGEIHSKKNAGGILCNSNSFSKKNLPENTKIVIKSCENTGNIIVDKENGHVGGIAGSWDVDYIPTIFDGCINTGKLMMMNSAPDKETLEKKYFTISRIMGGIVGLVGENSYITTDKEDVNKENIKDENAVLMIQNCVNSGSVKIQYDKEYVGEDGKEIYHNFCGDMIGFYWSSDKITLNIKNCTSAKSSNLIGNISDKDAGI